MDRNMLMILFVIGCFVGIIGVSLMQYLLTLIIIAFIVVIFLYSDFKTWMNKKNGTQEP
jgi:4-hydroxybenzoate polyprenyltransferase